MRKPAKKSITTWKNKCDKLFSEIVRSVGHCEYCGASGEIVQLQCAHINSRKYNATRWSTLNAVSLCAAHHRYFHDHPTLFTKWLEKQLGKEVLEELEYKSNQITKMTVSDYESLYEELKQKLQNAKKVYGQQ